MDSVLNLAPMEVPPEPSWWPLPVMFWCFTLAFLAILTMVCLFYRRKNRAKRAALYELKHLEIHHGLAPLDQLLRRVALTYYPRDELAGLTGRAWLMWLDSQMNEPRFISHLEQWQKALYSNKPVDSTTWHELNAISLVWISELKGEVRC